MIRFYNCGELSQMMGLVTEKACLQDLGPRDIQIYTKPQRPGPEVIKLEFILKLKIKHNYLLLVDTCAQAANHCTLF